MSASVVRVSATVAALMLSTLLHASGVAQDEVSTAPVPRAKPEAGAAPVEPPTPRAKPVNTPAQAPQPRVKPGAETVSRPQPPAPVAAVEPTPIPMPTQAQIEAGMLPCGEACGEVLFKTIDGCLWVQSQSPRPVLMQARIDGRLRELQLEGASYEKSTVAPAKDASAYHTRQKDPFQSSSAGIPVFRVRMGEKETCITDRGQISQLIAVFSR